MSSSRKWAGRLFQTRGPATAKLLSPNVLCVRGITAHDLSVEERIAAVDDLRRPDVCRRQGTFAVHTSDCHFPKGRNKTSGGPGLRLPSGPIISSECLGGPAV